jgi:hypothetical protein
MSFEALGRMAGIQAQDYTLKEVDFNPSKPLSILAPPKIVLN